MQPSQPRILIITTQTWRQVTRLALRFSRYGCRLSALYPPGNELEFYEGLHSGYTFKPGNPLESLQLAIARSGADYLVPGDDLAVWLLHELCERAPQYKDLIERSIGRANSFATVRSRYALLTLAAGLGIEVPETVLAPTVEAALAWSRSHALPFVLKKDGTFGGGGVEIVSDRLALPAHYARLNARPAALERLKQRLLPGMSAFAMPRPSISVPEVSAQVYVEGTAANAMFACDKGRVLGTVQARVVAAKGKTGPALYIDLVDDPRMQRAGELLAAALQISGYFGLDFILEKGTGVPYLIELNPRCTQMGHIALPHQADLAGVLWARWSGQPLPPVNDEELSAAVCFYPAESGVQVVESIADRARPDVCAEDRAIVDRLAGGNPALLARSYQAARAQLKALKYRVVTMRPAPLYYFEPAASPSTGVLAP